MVSEDRVAVAAVISELHTVLEELGFRTVDRDDREGSRLVGAGGGIPMNEERCVSSQLLRRWSA